MTGNQYEELVKRVARLARQNQELEELLRKSEKLIGKLSRENEKMKALSERAGISDAVKDKEVEQGRKTLRFDMATVLISGIKGFSGVSGNADPVSVMDELDEILFEIESIASGYNTVRIRTIGDTFMCAGGIPVRNNTNPVEVVMAAVEINAFIHEFETRKRQGMDRLWSVKTGIHTGPVMASVSGRKKINYDIKGDTVNTASRVEAVAENGSVVISVMTYELVKEFFDCEYHGKLPVRYKGDLQLYRVKGLKTGLSDHPSASVPNDAFRVKLGLIRFNDLQEIILDRLEKELPDNLFYHNVKHTVDVVTEVELIGWAEGCNDGEILLLKTAALFHDLGHTVSYDDHEYQGTILAREILPGFGYNQGQIEDICRLIMATRLPPAPENLSEKIMCDSDLDYLGRSDFIPVSNTLFEELKARGKMGSLNDWNKLQIKFISGHQYFTKTARSLREVNKQMQIERLRGLII